MYKATRDFINARKKHTNSPLRLPSGVKKLGTGLPSQCLNNSKTFSKEQKELGNDVIMISGWIIHPYDKVSESTEIIQHWWNSDAKGNNFDTTPYVTNELEYVIDFDINNYAYTNSDILESHVGMSLLYKGGKFFLLKNPQIMELEEITELKTELFFKYIK
jgi:hypothetical protein